MAFELWDGELGLSLGVFESEEAALEAVLRVCSHAQGSRAPLGLVEDSRRLVASGDALVEHAHTTIMRGPTHAPPSADPPDNRSRAAELR